MIFGNEQATEATSSSNGDRPLIHAVTGDDGTGAITIDGSTFLISEPTVAAARGAITGAAADKAVKIGRAVRMTAVGTDGEWRLIVHPDGTVEAEAAPDGLVPAAAIQASGGVADQDGDAVTPGDEGDDAAASGDEGDDAAASGDEEKRRSISAHVDGDAQLAIKAEDHAIAPPGDAARSTRPKAAGSTRRRGSSTTRPKAAATTPPKAAGSTVPTNDASTLPVRDGSTAPVGEGPSLTSGAAWPPPPSERSGKDQELRWDLPTLDDFLATQPVPAVSAAEWGWQARLSTLSFGLIKPKPSQAELIHRQHVATVQKALAGPRTIAVINPKGGAHKTTATFMIAATFAMHRGGYTLAWDNNETRGTLGWRARTSEHKNTAVNLLADLDRFDDATLSRVGDLDNYVRSQGSAMFDVLASDEDAGASASIDSVAFNRLHATLSRFYRLMVIDTGNNMRSTNWGAAIEAADQLVIVSSDREDTAASAAWLIDGLRQRRYEDKVSQAVTLLSSAGRRPEAVLTKRLHEHFGQLTRAVIDIPFDPTLVDGTVIDVNRLEPATLRAWLHACAVIAEDL